MILNISNIYYLIGEIRGAIQLRMIGGEFIQNNNNICIFSRRLTCFSSTGTIKALFLQHLLPLVRLYSGNNQSLGRTC